ncbi:guanylate kinase [bacterium]|nr:MAG: guanylate kinase [bacterium]
MAKGILFVISAPSGAGKSTLIKEVMGELGGIGFSVSHTTRPPRAGEIDGVNYHFVTTGEFKSMVSGGKFAEWALVHGNYYGTSLASLETVLGQGKDVILDIDVQGALNLRSQKNLAPVLIFILPPSLAEVERRLAKRGDTDAGTMAKRLENAAGEISEAIKYDYAVINDDLGTAAGELKAIITAERLKTDRMAQKYPGLFGPGI